MRRVLRKLLISMRWRPLPMMTSQRRNRPRWWTVVAGWFLGQGMFEACAHQIARENAVKYERMLPREIEALLEARPVAIVPWGALEWHGHHQAIGLDAIKASAIADAVADRLGAVSLPPVYAGYQTMKPHRGFRHCIEMSATTVGGMVRDYVSQLANEGFRLVVIITGHYGRRHVDMLRFQAEQVAEEVGVKTWVLAEYEVVKDLGYTGDHAARWETSLLWHIAPELVDLGLYREDLTGDEQGVMGENPAETASAEDGGRVFAAMAERIADRARAILDEPDQSKYVPWKPTPAPE